MNRSPHPAPSLQAGLAQPGYWRRLWAFTRDFKLLGAITLAAAALSAALYCLLVWLLPPEPVPAPFNFPSDATWITTSSDEQSTGSFRLDFSFSANIVNAWVVLAANGGYEMLVNGQSCAEFFLWRRTRPFQTSLSEEGQKLNPSSAAMGVNYPREYQWKDHDNAELPIWVDLTTHLKPGHNVLCVEVETNGTTPAVILSGEVELDTGEKIPLRSNARWVAEPVPKKLPQNDWILPFSPIADWNHARPLPWKRSFWSLVPPGVFTEPFRGQRIRSLTPGAVSWISQELILPKTPADGFLRIATDTPFRIWINDSLVRPLTSHPTILGYGPWAFREFSRSPFDLALDAPAETLDPSQTGTILPGRQRENPLGRDPAGNQMIPEQSSPGGTASHPVTEGILTLGSTSLKHPPNLFADPENPVRIIPPALTRVRGRAELLSYNITALLSKGKNTIRIGLYKDEPESANLSHRPFVAFDGGAGFLGGDSISFASGETTRSDASGPYGEQESTKADNDGPITPVLLPEKEFFGYAYPDRPWALVTVVIFILCVPIFVLSTSAVPALRRLFLGGSTACAVLAGWIAAGVLLRSSMLERSEALYWRFPLTSFLLLATGLAGAALSFLLQHRARKKEGSRLLCRLDLPLMKFDRAWVWPVLIGGGMALCFVARAWQLDLQPPDEDESASIQATLAIAKKGVPEYQEGVWYTRSPAYHYLAGLVAVLTGSNIYALRLLTVFSSCATAFLLWKMTRELTHNRFLALCALFLFAIHPFLIFTGHVARFYQQQQFFHLLMVYFFIRGFVANSGMRDRYLMVAAFLVGALSQEITVLEILPLTICYFLFAQKRSWPDEIRLLTATGCACALIGLDLAFFKIQCLTALDGISPRIDATVGWSFERPTNFLALLLGYSRLHLMATVFLLAGMVLAWRTKNTRWLFLYFYFFLSIATINLLITSRGYRFEYHLIPIWILLSLYGMWECAKCLIPSREASRERLTLAIGWFGFIVCSWSPWRVFNSYDSTLQADPVRSLRYVSNNLREGDKVAISELYPQTAFLELGHTDYDIAVPILYDFALRKKGKLVDRNAAAEVIGNLDELQRAFAENKRLWIVFDRDQMHARGSNVRWEFSGGRVWLYLQNNAHLMFRSSLWSVYLWDQDSGEYSNFRQKQGNWYD